MESTVSPTNRCFRCGGRRAGCREEKRGVKGRRGLLSDETMSYAKIPKDLMNSYMHVYMSFFLTSFV